MGGSAKRMASFAELIAKTIGHHTTDLKDLNMSKTDRFSFYKIGPVISVNVSCESLIVVIISTIRCYVQWNPFTVDTIGTA